MFKGLETKGRKAFTLIELLVVIAIIGLLLSIITARSPEGQAIRQGDSLLVQPPSIGDCGVDL